MKRSWAISCEDIDLTYGMVASTHSLAGTSGASIYSNCFCVWSWLQLHSFASGAVLPFMWQSS